MDTITAIFITIGVCLVPILIFFLLYRKQKNRNKELRNMALKLGLAYNEGPFEREMISGYFYNEIEGVFDGFKWKIFDYNRSYGRRPRTTQTQTVALVKINKHLPKFHLSTRVLLSSLSLFTFKPIISGIVNKDIQIKFDRHAEFSKKYIVRGKNKKAIKQAFNERVITYFEKKPRKLIRNPEVFESNGKELLYYKPGRTVKPSNLEAFIKEVKTLIALFTAN